MHQTVSLAKERPLGSVMLLLWEGSESRRGKTLRKRAMVNCSLSTWNIPNAASTVGTRNKDIYFTMIQRTLFVFIS